MALSVWEINHVMSYKIGLDNVIWCLAAASEMLNFCFDLMHHVWADIKETVEDPVYWPFVRESKGNWRVSLP